MFDHAYRPRQAHRAKRDMVALEPYDKHGSPAGMSTTVSLCHGKAWSAGHDTLGSRPRTDAEADTDLKCSGAQYGPRVAQDEQSTGQGAVWLCHLSKINFSTHHYLVT